MFISRKDLSAEELIDMSKMKKNSLISDRLKSIAYAIKGGVGTEIADRLDRSQRWVTKWVQRYNQLGVEGLFDAKRSGQPRKLTPQQEETFKQRVLNGPQEKDGCLSRFRASDLIVILKNEFGVDYTDGGVYLLLSRIGLSHIKPRPRHPLNDLKKSQEWQEAFPPFMKGSKQKIQTRKLKSGSKTKVALGSKA